jgi:hypothetical protein
MRKIFSFCTRAAQAVEVAVNIETIRTVSWRFEICSGPCSSLVPFSPSGGELLGNNTC